MRPFAVTIGALLALVLAVNGVAALGRWRQDERMQEAAAALRPGLAMAFDGHVDERRFLEARLRSIPPPRVVAFGSSRVRDASTPTMGAEPGEFYNLGVSGAAVEDYIAIWSLLRRVGKIPETAVFSIDAWVLSHSHEPVRWLALAPDVAQFLKSAGAARGGGWGTVEAARYRWLQATEFVSYTVLQESVRDLRRALAGRKRRGDDLLAALGRDVVPEARVAGRQGIRADGSVIRAVSPEADSRARRREEAVRYVATGAYALDRFRWDAERARHLELLWRDMRAHGVRLVAYMPPYHPAAWALLHADPAHAAALRSSAAFLQALAERVGARFLDLSDPAAVPCGEEEFYDAHHPRPVCLERISVRLRSEPAS